MEIQIRIRETRRAFWPHGGRFVRFSGPTGLPRSLIIVGLRSVFGWDALIRCWHPVTGQGEFVLFPTWSHEVNPGVLNLNTGHGSDAGSKPSLHSSFLE